MDKVQKPINSELLFNYYQFSILIDIIMGWTDISDGKTRNAYRNGLQLLICSRMCV
jgi:hypothetical protein